MFVIINKNTNQVAGTCTDGAFNAGIDHILIETALNAESGFVYDGNTLAQKIPPVPRIPLTNIHITTAVLHGSIYWVQESTPITITGDVTIPDGDYMIMAERVIDGSQVIDDARFVGTVLSCVLTIPITFTSTGNYLFSAARMNRGLDRIGAGIHLSFDDIEFDVYV